MREIKFRAKSVRSGEWVCGWYVKMAGFSYIIPENQQFRHPEDPDFENSFVDAFPETVSQFTGLKDGCGIEIYEGDIIKYKGWFPEKNEIIFYEGSFILKGIGEDEDLREFIIYDIRDIEVIGNIHQTKGNNK